MNMMLVVCCCHGCCDAGRGEKKMQCRISDLRNFKRVILEDAPRSYSSLVPLNQEFCVWSHFGSKTRQVQAGLYGFFGFAGVGPELRGFKLVESFT